MTKNDKTALEFLRSMREQESFPFATAVSEAAYTALRDQIEEFSWNYKNLPEESKVSSWDTLSEDQRTYAAVIISDALLDAFPALRGGLTALEQGRFDEVFGVFPEDFMTT